MKKSKTISQSAIIASLYVVLTLVSNTLGLANGAIQLRLSEALTILPCYTTAAIPGLAIGCFISNLITGCALWDVIFGSIATLIGAAGTYLLRKNKFISPISPIVANLLIIPFVLIYTYGAEESLPFLMLTIGLGELLSAGVLGVFMLKLLDKYKNQIFK